ncbi:glycoside hydrolase family 76 protein [Lederbergia graminis]|uniref:Glycoside hydrolase family 76 protein n=1 Tax=Lederbergia graminis TaxID=735518 RepID=A0ABW0LMT2_9BACI
MWDSYADKLQAQLMDQFWNQEKQIFNSASDLPFDKNSQPFNYWWYAHTVDVLIDGYIRTQKEDYVEKIIILIESVKRYNDDSLINDYYDDMEWMALALLRMYEQTKADYFKNKVFTLWTDIKTAWNDHMGGGMAWRKTQLDYKNTPANAPAAILAARLYRNFHDETDLKWAQKIYEFNKKMLVNSETGFVYDGINRLGDGEIDKDWKFTYCQGVFIGAAIELHSITSEEKYLEDARKTVTATLNQLVNAQGLLQDEGGDDAGLFKGILVRYLTLYYQQYQDEKVKSLLLYNAEQMKAAIQADQLIGTSWEQPKEQTQLSTYLSGMMLVESAAILEKNHGEIKV